MAVSQDVIDDLAARGAERGIDLRPGMLAVEARLDALVRVEDMPFLDTVSRYLLDAGGKRFRPMLTLLTGLAGGAAVTAPDLVDAGAIVELVHVSTLSHDGVMDDPELRRGLEPAHRERGVVLGGVRRGALVLPGERQDRDAALDRDGQGRREREDVDHDGDVCPECDRGRAGHESTPDSARSNTWTPFTGALVSPEMTCAAIVPR